MRIKDTLNIMERCSIKDATDYYGMEEKNIKAFGDEYNNTKKLTGYLIKDI